jgi:hypothetical protein
LLIFNTPDMAVDFGGIGDERENEANNEVRECAI